MLNINPFIILTMMNTTYRLDQRYGQQDRTLDLPLLVHVYRLNLSLMSSGDIERSLLFTLYLE